MAQVLEDYRDFFDVGDIVIPEAKQAGLCLP
jgi:hypothetical protein